jgi:hypothetical protein
MSAQPRRRSRLLTRGGPVIAGLLACAATAVPASAAVPESRQLEIWPGIEMGVVSGYQGDVRVDVLRGAAVVATKVFPDGGGEVQHDAGNCWEGVPAGRSPDIKGGDKIQATVLGGPLAGTVDFFFVRNIQFDEPTPGTISGTAFGVPNGGGFDLTAPMTGETIAAQRRADARFDGQGVVDAAGNFSFPLDGVGGGVASDFLDGGGNTVTEAHNPADPAPGPACGQRVTTTMSSASHSVINMETVNQDLVVGGPSEGPGSVTSVTFGGKSYTPTVGAETWTATVPKADLAALVDNNNYDLTAKFADGSPDETRVVRKDVTAPVVASTVASGSYTTPQDLALYSDGGEAVRYTLDGSLPRDTSRTYDGLPLKLGNGSHTVRAMAIDAAGNRSDATYTFEIAAASTAPAPPAAPPVVTLTTVLQPSRSLAIAGLRSTKRVSSRSARRNGLRVTMDLKRGTKVLQLSVYRRVNGRRRLIGQVVRKTNRSGAYAARLRTAKLRKAFKPGLFEIVATPGTSQSALVAADQSVIRVRVTR